MSDALPRERLMQYVWQHRLWLPADMRTVDGTPIEVIDPGLLNNDAGPDFFNAKLRIGDRLWAGNVEIHVRASDWYAHGHDRDHAYDTVILHVVDTDDCRITRPGGDVIPQTVLACARDFSKSYHEMVDKPGPGLACAAEIASLPSIYISDWLTALAFERLYTKADRVEQLTKRLNGDWREAVYVTLARALGFHTNSDAFERLALATPLSRLLHHQGDLATIEGTLFGQAGLLPSIPTGTPEGDYVARLGGEHRFLAAKYGLTPLRSPGWKMARMRPQNFPHRRIAVLAATVSEGFSIARRILNVRNADDAVRLFDVQPGPFWASHYTFEPSQGRVGTALGSNSVNTLIINVVVPVIYAYGRCYGNNDMQEAAVDILQGLPPEQNSVIRLFEAGGISCGDSFTSQALLELRRNYCEPRKCLYCRLGHRFLAHKAILRPTTTQNL